MRALGHADTRGLVPKFTITDNKGTPYLTRYYLFRCERFRVFLHKFHRSDDDRAMHDHPWPFVTVLLHGLGYYEHTPEGVDYYPPFSVSVRLNPARPHRVELERTVKPDGQAGPEAPQWTLFIAGRNVRKWGFHVSKEQVDALPVPAKWHSTYVPDHYFVHHDVFLNNKFAGVEDAVMGLEED